MLNLKRFWLLLSIFGSANSYAQNYSNSQSTRFRSQDYLLKSFNDENDKLFNETDQVIDLGANMGIGSDCGRVNFEGTLKSSLKNLLDAKYFGDLGKNIMAASPMLLTCYMSPTWCAILKHTQVSANFLSQMRLNQCALIDKYTDNRSDDFYRERQECIRKRISDNGGNLEEAMDGCQDPFNSTISNWAGHSKGGDKVDVNKLIDSSVKWAGLTGAEAGRTTDLVKSFVGDTVVTKGNVSVEYGPTGKVITPEKHLVGIQNETYQSLCQTILPRITDQGQSVDQAISANDLNNLSKGADRQLIDRQTIESLSFLPPRQRSEACRKLSNALALTVFSKDISKSMDVLTVASQNPNLPPNRREEILQKRQALKDSIELTLGLQRQRNDPLREALSEINQTGEERRSEYSETALRLDEKARSRNQNKQLFFDCADAVFCNGG